MADAVNNVPEIVTTDLSSNPTLPEERSGCPSLHLLHLSGDGVSSKVDLVQDEPVDNRRFKLRTFELASLLDPTRGSWRC